MKMTHTTTAAPAPAKKLADYGTLYFRDPVTGEMHEVPAQPRGRRDKGTRKPRARNRLVAQQVHEIVHLFASAGIEHIRAGRAHMAMNLLAPDITLVTEQHNETYPTAGRAAKDGTPATGINRQSISLHINEMLDDGQHQLALNEYADKDDADGADAYMKQHGLSLDDAKRLMRETLVLFRVPNPSKPGEYFAGRFSATAPVVARAAHTHAEASEPEVEEVEEVEEVKPAKSGMSTAKKNGKHK